MKEDYMYLITGEDIMARIDNPTLLESMLSQLML